MNAFVYTWAVDEEESTTIRMYCLMENDKESDNSGDSGDTDDSGTAYRNACIVVKDFTPYVYIELYNDGDVKLLDDELNEYTILTKLVYKQHLYNFKPGTRPFLFCQCRSRNDINEIVNRLRSPVGGRSFKCHEESASSILQMVSLRSINMTGWFRFDKASLVSRRTTCCDYEYMVSWRQLSPSSKTDIVYPKTIAFDLEVNSELTNAMPDDRPGDAIFQISCVVQQSGPTGLKLRYLLTLDGTDLVDNRLLDGIIVIAFRSERELLAGFYDFLRRERPNILTGYNILGFDIEYLIRRSNRFMLMNDMMMSGFNRSKPAQEGVIRWASVMYKNKTFPYIDWEGILLLDLLPVIKRDYKFDNYKLQTVATIFLNAGKDPVTYKDIFDAYKSKRFATVGKYCVQDSELCIDIMNHIHCWITLAEMSKVCNVSIFTLHTQGQQIKIYSQIYKHCLKRNIIVDSDGYTAKINERYTGAYVFDPVPGYYENVIPLDFSSLYPSIMIAYNICYSTIVDGVGVVADKDCNTFIWEDHVGCDHDPKIIEIKEMTKKIDDISDEIKELTHKRDGLRAKDVVSGGRRLVDARRDIQLEINRLRENQKPFREKRQELKKGRSGGDGGGGDDGYGKVICARREYRFLKASVKKGVVPMILENLLSSRKSVKNKMKLESIGSDERVILDKEQLAYKVSANSMYGAMGVRRGYLPFMPGAMCITYLGRSSIEKTAKVIVDKWRGVLVYGDTDSNYVTFPHLSNDITALWDYAIEVGRGVSTEFPEPMKLEFEQTIYRKFFILSKKRYMYQEVARDGTLDSKIGKKGVILARRDNSGILKYIYEKMATMIFDKLSSDEIQYYLLNYINDIFRNVIDKSEYIITKSVGDSDGDIDEDGRVGRYKVKALPDDPVERDRVLNGLSEREYYTKSFPAHIQLAERMKARGVPVDIGSRIEYVVTHNPLVSTIGARIEDYDYYKTISRFLKLDAMYYLHSLINPLDQMLMVAIGDGKFLERQYLYRGNYNKVVAQVKEMSRPTIKIITNNEK